MPWADQGKAAKRDTPVSHSGIPHMALSPSSSDAHEMVQLQGMHALSCDRARTDGFALASFANASQPPSSYPRHNISKVSLEHPQKSA